MNSDHFFAIGSTHDTCEDYAMAGNSGNSAYAIVCDGCSSSPNVDFGARVLALSAREILRMARGSPMDYHAFGKTAIRRADTIMCALPSLSPDFLDATLLVAWVDDGQLTAYLYGDGMFFHQTEQSLRCVHIKYSVEMDGVCRPAPAYLSYMLKPDQKADYEKCAGKKEVYDGIHSFTQTERSALNGTTTVHKLFEPTVIQAPVRKGDVIALCTDGIDSFRRPDDSSIEWHDMVNDFIGFKTFEGVFVKRRLNFMLKRCKKDSVSHTDDIGMAAIVI